MLNKVPTIDSKGALICTFCNHIIIYLHINHPYKILQFLNTHSLQSLTNLDMHAKHIGLQLQALKGHGDFQKNPYIELCYPFLPISQFFSNDMHFILLTYNNFLNREKKIAIRQNGLSKSREREQIDKIKRQSCNLREQID